MSAIETAVLLARELDRLFTASEAAWPEGARASNREIPVGRPLFRLSFMPWRAQRRPAPSAPPAGPDAAARILGRECLWRADGIAATPNRFPVARRHLLLWETELRREPSPGLLELLASLARERPALLGFVNSIGAAATIPRAHAQLLEEPGSLALDTLPVVWEEGPGCEVGFPGPEAAVFVAALRGDPARVAAAAVRLLALRRDPAFNLVARRETLYVFFRRAERVPEAYPLPIGALELSGCFIFEDEESFLAMTGPRCLAALAGACHPPGPGAAEAVRAALAGS